MLEHQAQYASALQSYQRALTIYQQLGEHRTSVGWTINSIARAKPNLSTPARVRRPARPRSLRHRHNNSRTRSWRQQERPRRLANLTASKERRLRW